MGFEHAYDTQFTFGNTVSFFENAAEQVAHAHVQPKSPYLGFAISVKTPILDNCGKAHACEHLVLAGSKKYPVRSGIFDMLGRTNVTYINAFTSPETTTYVFVTTDKEDFWGLLDVTLNSVFYPLFERDSFLREVHRPSISRSMDGALIKSSTGVIYNEMRGDSDDINNKIWRSLCSAALSGSPNSFNAGGEPSLIKRLKNRDIRKFHRTHYNRSNCLFMSYGDISLDRFHETILENTPSPKARPEKTANSFTSGSVIQLKTAQNTGSKAGKSAIAWLDHPCNDNESYWSKELFFRALAANYNSQITPSKGIKLLPLSGFRYTEKFSAFIFGKDSNSESITAEIPKLLLSTCYALQSSSADTTFEFSATAMELKLRKRTGDMTPEVVAIFTDLQEMYSKGFLSHGKLPNPDNFSNWRNDESAKDGVIKYGQNLHQRLLNVTELPALVVDTRLSSCKKPTEIKPTARHIAFVQRQQQRLSETLSRSKIETLPLNENPAQKYVYEAKKLYPALRYSESGTYVYDNPVPDVAHLEFNARALETGIDLGWRYGLVTASLGDYIFRDLPMHNHLRLAASIRAGHVSRSNPKGVDGRLAIYLSCLEQHVPQVCAALSERLRQISSTTSDAPYWKQAAEKWLSNGFKSLLRNGHSQCVIASRASHSELSQFRYKTSGLMAFKDFFEECKQPSTHDYQQLVPPKMFEFSELMYLCSDGDRNVVHARDLLKSNVELAHSSLNTAANNINVPFNKKEAWAWDRKINHCAASWSLTGASNDTLAALSVFSRLLKSQLLHPKIRDNGSAYGVGAICDWDTKSFTMYTFRDADIAPTIDIFLKVVSEKNSIAGIIEAGLKYSTLETLSSLNKPMSPSAFARVDFHNRILGSKFGLEQTKWDLVTSISTEKVILAVNKYLVKKTPSIAAIVNSDQISNLGDDWEKHQINWG